MIYNLFKNRFIRILNAINSSKIFKIPNNARSIRRCADSLIICSFNLYSPYSSSVFFHWCFHSLSLFTNFENSNFSFVSSRNDSLIIRSNINCSNSMEMCIINYIHKFSWLRIKRSYFSIIPSWQDTFTIMTKLNTITFKIWNLNS